MSKSHNLKLLSVASVLGMLISFTAGVASADTIIKIDGSSTVYPITEGVAEDFQIANINQ